MNAPAAPRPTRDRILEAAMDRFGSQGFPGTSLDEIAADVGVRKQTVLYWFPSKDELLAAAIDLIAGQLVAEIATAIHGVAMGFVRVEATVKAVFRTAVRRPHRSRRQGLGSRCRQRRGSWAR